MKIMSVDYGDARTGIAFCDKNEILATAFATINESYQPKLIEKIKEIISSQNPEMIVIGLPRNMDGSYGFLSSRCLLCSLRGFRPIPCGLTAASASGHHTDCHADCQQSRCRFFPFHSFSSSSRFLFSEL